MRYHIDTIPVWDAYKHEESECPICDLKAYNEEQYLTSFLGASVMEPTTRVEVNEKYFCQKHLAGMLGLKNRLGLGLMTLSHLKAREEALGRAALPGGGFLRRGPEPGRTAKDTCVLCERLETTVSRYLFTVVCLWRDDKEFKKQLLASRGLCLPHYDALMRMAGETLSKKDCQAFAEPMRALEKENLARLEGELEWFTKKFDHANLDKPWGTSRDALERAVAKLRGR